MNCGCKIHIEVDWDVGETTDSEIEYCPLHLSATLLRDALEALYKEIATLMKRDGINGHVWCIEDEVLRNTDAALTASKGEST